MDASVSPLAAALASQVTHLVRIFPWALGL